MTGLVSLVGAGCAAGEAPLPEALCVPPSVPERPACGASSR